MHDADNEVTQADREAVAEFIEDYWCGNHAMGVMARSYRAGQKQGAFTRHFARHRIASVEAACREKDAEIEQARDDAATFCIQSLASRLGNPDYAQADGSEEWAGDVSGTLYNVLVASGVLSEDDHSFATLAERDQLRAKLDEATKVLADVSAAMLMGGDGAVGDYGWSIGKLNQARPAIRAFLASAPEPLISKEQAIKLAEMEGDAEIGAGMPDHPLRQPEQKAQGVGGEPVGHAGSMPGTAGFTMAAFRAADVPIGTPLYAQPPTPVEAGGPVPEHEGLSRENAAWAWLEQKFGTTNDDPMDRVYDASEMVDAFHAGCERKALSSRPASEEG